MLPKRNRLKDREEERTVKKKKEIISSSPLLDLIARRNNQENSRLSVKFPKNFGNAVERNRAKRRIKSVFLENMPGKECLDIIVYLKRSILEESQKTIRETFKKAIQP